MSNPKRGGAVRGGRLMIHFLLLAAAIFAFAGVTRADDEVVTLAWEDLLPEGELERLEQLYNEFYDQVEQKWANAQEVPLSQADPVMIEEGSPADYMPQIGTFNVVDDLDGLNVRMPGYVVPLSFNKDDKYSEFLLVPYFGACLHTPPPPPNQIVYVTAERPAELKETWLPIWVEGTMSTTRNENDLGDAAYTLALSKVEPYEY